MKFSPQLQMVVCLFMAVFQYNLFAQSPPCYNTSCASALRVCSHTYQDFDFYAGNDASCGNTTLYYIFQFAGSTPGLQVNLINASGTWEIYGPFNSSALTNCELVNSYLNQLASGNFSNSNCIISNPLNKYYLIKVKPQSCSGTVEIAPEPGARLYCSDQTQCSDCISSFAPSPGKYIVSAWVKEDQSSAGTTNYTNPYIEIDYVNSSQVNILSPQGVIIDGWQRIEGIIDIPVSATNMSIKLKSNAGDVFFDDIRFFPKDGSMMSYVYDPVSLRLMAELDERNYATFYEYDEEGKLIRVKKETERGIMTIQENRENILKQ
jgi:hypothetical protein